MRITLGYDRREYGTVRGIQPGLSTWQRQECWSQRSPLVILANTQGKERPEIRDNDGVPVRSRTLVEVSWGRACRSRGILQSARSSASRQLWVQAGLCVCVRGSGAALSKVRSAQGDIKLAF